MERPGVTALLKAVRELSVDCIVVKDFSRFSRDYIELGTYLDQIFPFMGIRFISINDDYDSACCRGTGGIEVPFKNLLYDLYSKDLSLKVKSSLGVKKKEGQFVSAGVPFGYKKAPEDKHRLIIKEEEAEIVRRIFELTLEGMSSVQIARLFNQEKVKTPAASRKEEGEFCKAPKGGNFLWSSSGICHILENQVYVGDMVYGKYEKERTGGKTRLKPKKEWKVCFGHHQPLISREVFLEIQEKRGVRKKAEAGQRHPLTGILVCAGCKRNLRIRKGRNFYFCCGECYVSGRKHCVRKLDGAWVEQYVLEEIQKRAQEGLDMKAAWEMRRETLAEQIAERRKKREGIRRELSRIQREKLAVYEQFVRQKEDKEELKRQEQSFGQKVRELEAQLARQGQELEEVQEEAKKERELPVILAFLGLTALTRELVLRWIKEIHVEDGALNILWKEQDF